MSTTINTGWLKDNNGEKFAPKTLASQVLTPEGITFEEKIQAQLENIDSASDVELTKAEYDALGDVVLTDGKTYFITDIDGGTGGSGGNNASNVVFDDTDTQMGVDNIQDAVEKCFQSVSNGKSLMASAITDKGVTTASDATFETMANNIKSIKTVANDTTATATAANITLGQTAWVNGVKVTGTRPAPVTKLTGTFDLWIPTTNCVTTKIIEFSTPFDKVPTVSVNITKTGNLTDTSDWKINAVTRTNFTFSTRGNNWKYVTISVKWVAEA